LDNAHKINNRHFVYAIYLPQWRNSNFDDWILIGRKKLRKWMCCLPSLLHFYYPSISPWLELNEISSLYIRLSVYLSKPTSSSRLWRKRVPYIWLQDTHCIHFGSAVFGRWRLGSLILWGMKRQKPLTDWASNENNNFTL
jgi:hypothetical protein